MGKKLKTKDEVLPPYKVTNKNIDDLLIFLTNIAKQVTRGRYGQPEIIFELAKTKKYPERITELAESFGMMIVKVEARDFRLEKNIKKMKKQNEQLQQKITELKRTEKALIDSEEKYRNIVEMAPDAIGTVNLKGIVTSCNYAFTALTGFSKNEIVGKHFLKNPILKAKDFPKYLKAFNSLLRGKIPDPFEITWIHKDGSSRLTEICVGLMKKDGKISGIQAIGRDITERKQMEEKLIHLSNALKASSDSIVISDLEGKITDVNETTLNMYGTDNKADLIGKSSFDIIAPEDREKAIAGMKEVMEKGYIKDREYNIVIKDGGKIPVEMSTSIMKGTDGEPTGFVAVTRDITERKLAEDELELKTDQIISSQKEIESLYAKSEKARKSLLSILQDVKEKEQALRESEGRFRDVVNNTGDWIWELDKEGRYIYSSPVVKQVIGYEDKEVLGKHFYDFFHPDERDELKKAAFEVFKQKEGFKDFINRNVHKDGHVVILETSGVPLLDDSGSLLGYRGVDRDVTERKQAEEELQKRLQELEIYYKATMGREGRIIELKQQVNELLVQIGKEKKYDV